MSAAEQLTKLSNLTLANQLIQILPKLLESNTQTIDEATSIYKKLSEDNAFLPTLTQIMISKETDIGTRQLSAVLFRRRILKKWTKFDFNMQELVRSASLEYRVVLDWCKSGHLGVLASGLLGIWAPELTLIQDRPVFVEGVVFFVEAMSWGPRGIFAGRIVAFSLLIISLKQTSLKHVQIR